MIDVTSSRCMARLHDIEAIDYFLAKALHRTLGSDSETLFHLLLAMHWMLRQGHACLVYADIADRLLWTDSDSGKAGYRFDDVHALESCLQKLDLKAESGKPVVLECGRLYLRRYWRFETELAEAIRSRVQPQPLSQDELVVARETLTRLFPKAPIDTPVGSNQAGETDWQAIAVANALNRRLSVISGGPGTGKTYTITRLLATLQSIARGQLRIAMAAPTGKAKQRLLESIADAKIKLAGEGLSPPVLNSIPEDANTLHGLLGIRSNSTRLMHGPDNPLAIDLLLIDEVSMVDMPMMTRVLRALPDSAKLILVGDANQLPSIAVGSVLSDLVKIPHPGYSAATAETIADLTGYRVPCVSSTSQDYISFLYRNHRFDGKGGIGLLANEVINLDADSSWKRLQTALVGDDLGDNASQEQLAYVAPESMGDWLEKAVEHYYHQIGTAPDIESAFEHLTRFRVLVPTRVGELGVETLNNKIEGLLALRNPEIKSGRHYHGRPIMITRNQHALKVYNGDVGLVWRDESGLLKAWFEQEGKIRSINLGLLYEVESVYAMTIHKTQGSEYGHVAILLPDQPGKLLSPELLYTGITRAKKRCYIGAAEAVWRSAMEKRMVRNSGLGERLALADCFPTPGDCRSR